MNTVKTKYGIFHQAEHQYMQIENSIIKSHSFLCFSCPAIIVVAKITNPSIVV